MSSWKTYKGKNNVMRYVYIFTLFAIKFKYKVSENWVVFLMAIVSSKTEVGITN